MSNLKLLLRVTAIVGAFAVVGCNSQSPAPGADTGASKASAGSSGGMHLKADTKQLMNWILDYNADKVWAVGGTIITKEGQHQNIPKTDDEWNEVRNAAAVVAEASNLLLVPPHSRNNDDWNAMTYKLIDEANKCVEAAEAKDVDNLFKVAGNMYEACTACHAKYVIGQESQESK